LLLKQVGELTYAEIAALLGIAEGTVKSRLHAATLAFRARLVELGEG
ncbi:MAG: RNA polymerase sigma factor, partial [Myxococcales bacterium]|nr:RNA polymerase sigma factor [Myxococcales bacterium]